MTALDRLDAAERAMTGGRWATERPEKDADGWQRGVVVAATARGQMIYSAPPGGSFPEADRQGIANLRNAARPLIDLARAVDVLAREWADTSGSASNVDGTNDAIRAVLAARAKVEDVR